MPIRYCSATSKRTKKPCRARAMRGMKVCYHHGGKSKRGRAHKNFKHGYYSTDPLWQMLWSMTETDYRQALRLEQMDVLTHHLKTMMPVETAREFQRFLKARRVATATLGPLPKHIPPEMIEAAYAYLCERWPGLSG